LFSIDEENNMLINNKAGITAIEDIFKRECFFIGAFTLIQ
jgi:hypothetical protein